MTTSRNDFVPVEGDLSLDSVTSHVVPGSERSQLDSSKPTLGDPSRFTPQEAPSYEPSNDPNGSWSGDASPLVNPPKSVDDPVINSGDPQTDIWGNKNNFTIGGLTFPTWQPDDKLSPSENLESLTNWLSKVFQFYTFETFPSDFPKWEELSLSEHRIIQKRYTMIASAVAVVAVTSNKTGCKKNDNQKCGYKFSHRMLL